MNHILSRPVIQLILIVGCLAAPCLKASQVVSGCAELADPRQAGLPDPPAGTAKVTCAMFFPFAVTTDGLESSRIEVRIEHPGVTYVSIGNAFPIVGVSVQNVDLPQTGGTVELFDDGTHGDKVGGDGIWSRDGFRVNAIPSPPVFFYEFSRLTYKDQSGVHEISIQANGTNGQYGPARLGRLSPDLPISADSLGDGIFITNNVAFIVDEDINAELRWLIQAVNPPADIRSVSKKFYKYFGDEFDVLLLTPASHVAGGLRGAHLAASNTVSGIGRNIFDSTSDWGSDGKLQSVIAFNLSEGGPLIHELTHRWGLYFGADMGLQQCAPAHVGLAGTGCGPIGGFDPDSLVDNGDGTWTVSNSCFSTGGAAADTTELNPLNLYLAGLIPASQVPPIPVPVNADCSSITQDFGTQTVTFAADGISTVTIEDIVAELGPRLPAPASSQRDFRMGWVVYSNRNLTETEIGWFQYRSEYIARNTDGDVPLRLTFSEATGGRASLNTLIRDLEEIIFLHGFEGL